MGCSEGRKGLGTTVLLPVMTTTSVPPSRARKLTASVGWTALVVGNCFLLLTLSLAPSFILVLHSGVGGGGEFSLFDLTTLQHERQHPHLLHLLFSRRNTPPAATPENTWCPDPSVPAYPLVNGLQSVCVPVNCLGTFEEKPRAGLTSTAGALIQVTSVYRGSRRGL